MAHKAIIAKIDKVVPIVGADSIQIGVVLGEQVIVSKSLFEGYVGVLFPADLQLSEEYCHHNNLFRSANQNKDKNKTGFFEASRRVRVQPFLKVKSQAYFAPLESLDYTQADISALSLGTQFDELNGKKICQKYISEATRVQMSKQNKPKQAKAVTMPYFAKHVDSEQFKHYAHLIPAGSLLSFHSKRHGTSFRTSLTKVVKELPKWKQWINKYVPMFPTETYELVTGTRNTVLEGKGKEGFHGSEQFRFDVSESLAPYLTKGMTVYGEICGYANGKPIMAVHNSKALKDKAFTKKYGENIVYKYGCKEHEYVFHIYRITYLSEDGTNVDFTQKQLEDWCQKRLIMHTVDVHPQIVYEGDVEKLKELVETLTERTDSMCEDVSDPSHPSEGIIIRVDDKGFTPKFYKSKGYAFRVMEGIAEAADTEDAS